MSRRTLWVHATLALLVTGPALGQGGAPVEVRARIARVERSLVRGIQVEGEPIRAFSIAERMEHYQVPGVSVAVIHDGRLEWARGYGVEEAGTDREVSARTLFQAASISKPLAAMAALKLVEQGRLSLDEDVNARLQGWKLPLNGFTGNGPVTLRRLLSHSAGTTVSGFRGYAAGEPVPTVEQILLGAPPANSAAIAVDVEPGKQWRYSGGGTTLVQHLVTQTVGRPFPELMREIVLGPLGMTESGYEQPLPLARTAHAATGHRADGSPVAGRYHTYPEMAAAGMWTTATDLARYVMAVQSSLAGTWNPVLSPETTLEMLTPGLNDWGLGPWLEGEGKEMRFAHSGGNEGFRALFVGYLRDGRGAVVLTNGDRGHLLLREIVLAIAAEYGWPGYGPRKVTAIPLDAGRRSEYAGDYEAEVPAGPMVSVVEADGALMVRLGRQPVARLVPTAPDVFLGAEEGQEIRFERDDRGRIVALRIVGGPRALRKR